MTSLKKLAIRGTVWTVASYGASLILRLGSNLILTRLLFPKLFGLMALVSIFLTGLHLFSDIGVGPSIIQNKRGDDPTFLNTAWTLQVIRGFCLWFCSLLIAWPVAEFYGDPQFLWLLPVVSLSAVISGFNSTAGFTLSRHIALGQLAIFELGIQVISVIVTVLWAWFSPTIWALVVGWLVSDLLRMVWSHRLIPGSSNRFAWDQKSVNSLFSFGRWIFLSTAMTFLGAQADRLILGKLFSLEMLGVYSIAFNLAQMPAQLLQKISSSVIFPVVSKQAEMPRELLRSKILDKRKFILVCLALPVTILIGFGDKIILFLYDERYAQASWMLPILGFGLWITVLSSTMSPALLAIGKPLYIAYGCFFRFLLISIGLPIIFPLVGTVGAITLIAFGDLPYYAAVVYGLWREDLMCIGQDIKITALFLALLTVVLIARVSTGFELPINGLL